ncbi:MAG: hypothetical protein FWF54_10305 [Candidatus Azobacteroides sp.]|nr:hypothetical protein [Candidatus Azobacteroides sp.]
MEFTDLEGSGKQLVDRRRFNDKELQSDFGLNWYDFVARGYDPAVVRPWQIDPLAEKRPWESPYLWCGGNPMNAIDPDGRDYWSTNNPELIRQFINSVGRNAQYYDFSGWNHATDAQFTANLTYNDNTGKFYTSYTTIESGEVTAVSKSFDANLKPVSLTGQGYPGAFVYNYAGGMGGLYGIGYDAAQFLDASSLVSNLAGFDPHYYGDWNVDASGRITGLNAFQLAKKSNGKSLSRLFIKGFGEVDKSLFHDVIKKIF